MEDARNRPWADLGSHGGMVGNFPSLPPRDSTGIAPVLELIPAQTQDMNMGPKIVAASTHREGTRTPSTYY